MALSVKNLKAGYGGAVAIRNLTTTIPEGRITALIGPNGSCKSTLLKTLARLLPPMAGEATVDGRSIYGLNARAFSRKLSLLPQHQLVPEGITVRTLVGYGQQRQLA